MNPNAPKGGRITLVGSSAVNTFDTFNPYILKGDKAQGLSLLFDSLMTSSADEPDAVYGLVASSAEVAADKRSVTFKMRPASAKLPLRAVASKARRADREGRSRQRKT